MPDAAGLSALFRRNFPFAVREEAAVLRILGDPGNRVFERRDEAGRLIGAAVVRGGAIILLCVDAAHRRRGLGGALLAEAEAFTQAAGYGDVVVGAGDDYLTPGVPTSKRFFLTAAVAATASIKIKINETILFIRYFLNLKKSPSVSLIKALNRVSPFKLSGKNSTSIASGASTSAFSISVVI